MWYRHKGLHDARLLALARSDTAAADGHMVITLFLDAKNALSDTEITEIRLHLAAAKMTLPDMTGWRAAYVLSDSIQPFDAYPNPLYRLVIRLLAQSADGTDTEEAALSFTITHAEILRQDANTFSADGATMLWRTSL